MNKYLSAALMIGLMPMVTMASASVSEDPADSYFSKNNPELTPQEKAAIKIAERWKASSATGVKPVPGPDGTVRFLFGVSQPSIVCAPLQACDLELQPGEWVDEKSIHLGDKARWSVEPAISGYGANEEIMHLIIKPMDVGLDTSLVITTNR